MPFPEELVSFEGYLAKMCHQDLCYTFVIAAVKRMVIGFHFPILHLSD